MTIYSLENRPEGPFNTPILITDMGFLIFDSEDEWSNFITQKSSIFDLNEYKLSLTLAVQEFLDSTAKALWYDSMDEVPTCNVVGGKWESEAKSLLLWNSKVWEDLDTYFKTNIIETNSISINTYLNDIISFNDFNTL